VSVINVSVVGAQVMHAQPLRIGTTARLAFRYGDVSVSVLAQVMWSHLWQTSDGHAYRSGVRLDAADVQYAAAVNALIRTGAIQRDTESLERKRQREAERELRRKSGPKISPVPPPPIRPPFRQRQMSASWRGVSSLKVSKSQRG
jgi:hypothetical protein